MLVRGCLHLIALPAALALISLLLVPWSAPAGLALFSLLAALSVLMAVFFRDPERDVGKGVVSPADGVLTRVDATPKGAFFSIFMNIYDVHVNRAPWPGKVIEVVRIPGRHAPAFLKRADGNERLRITMETSLGRITITQVVGIFARRIVPYVRAGQELAKGERIGMIRFGSRVELFIPSVGIRPRVRRGERVLAGSTTLATVKRAGERGAKEGGGRGRAKK